MRMKCFNCDTAESAGLNFSCCKACRNVIYCSRVCQRENWKEHKQICKSLVMGASGSMQVKELEATSSAINANEALERMRRAVSEDADFAQFCKLFQESKPGGRRATALKMKQIALRQDQDTRETWVLPILMEVAHVDVDRLMWPSSPLLVLLACLVDHNPTAPLGGIHQQFWFSWLASLTHPDGHHIYYTRQILLAKQLVSFGVDVNAGDWTPLYFACSTRVINLEYIEFLLQSGADPNAIDPSGMTPFMYTLDWAPGAAKVLIEWSATDVNIVSPSGHSMLAHARMRKEFFSGMTDSPTPERPRRAAEDQFLLQQWLEVEEMLMDRGAQ
jgi:hypothetical protein